MNVAWEDHTGREVDIGVDVTPDDVAYLHAKAAADRDVARQSAARLHRAVAAALGEGVSATTLAQVLDVSRGRIYQLARKAD